MWGPLLPSPCKSFQLLPISTSNDQQWKKNYAILVPWHHCLFILQLSMFLALSLDISQGGEFPNLSLHLSAA